MSIPPWSYIGLITLWICLAMIKAAPSQKEDEQTIRDMVDEAISRLNRGDVAAFDDLWDERADYVGVDGRPTKGRSQIQKVFREMAKGAAGTKSQR